MKKLFLASLAVLMGLNAEASSGSSQLYSQLDSFNFAVGSDLEHRRIQSGNVTINLEAGRIELTLFPSFYCPPDRNCAQVMPAPIVVSAPLQSIEEGACRTIVYTASKDYRMVDGVLETITVTDNSRNPCQTLVPLKATEVRYSIEGGERRYPSPNPHTIMHYFGGDTLRPISAHRGY